MYSRKEKKCLWIYLGITIPSPVTNGTLEQRLVHSLVKGKVIGSNPICSANTRLTQRSEWFPYKELVESSNLSFRTI